jgi:hypothetical protein
VYREVGSEDGHRSPPTAKEREKAWLTLAGQAEEGRTGALHELLNFGIGGLHRLSFEPQVSSRRLDPAPERLITIPPKTLRRGRGFDRLRRQIAPARERLEGLTQS